MNTSMRKFIRLALAAGIPVLMTAGCAKEREAGANEDEKLYFDAWMAVHHPDAVPSGNGIYILDDREGDGESVDGANYLFVTYTTTDLDGNITATSDITKAQQLGTYEKAYYYGPNVWTVIYDNLYVGVADMISGMKIGGTRTAVIPSWLMTYERQDSPEKYLEKSSGNSSTIYTVKIIDKTDDIIQWQIDSLEKFTEKYLEGVDSTFYGFYYKQLTEPTDTNAFSSDTTIYINYTGRLLNGQVFDTTIEDTAKMYNIWSSSNTYKPVEITWAESKDDITMSVDDESTNMISGFTSLLWEMRNKERAVGVFYSSLGYGSSSTSMMPAYAPLLFDIEITEAEE